MRVLVAIERSERTVGKRIAAAGRPVIGLSAWLELIDGPGRGGTRGFGGSARPGDGFRSPEIDALPHR